MSHADTERLSSRRGSVLILTAILLTLLLGVAGFAIDAGNLSDYRHRMQSAADAGAVAGAQEVKRDGSITIDNLRLFVFRETAANGFANGNGTTVTVNHGPSSGAFANNAKYVEVIISRSVPTYLMSLLGRSAVTVTTRAVAGQLSGTPGCLYTRGTGQNSFQTASSAEIHLPNCDIFVNSDNSKAVFTGDATVEAHAFNVVGGLGGSPQKTNWIIDGQSKYPTTGADPVDNPYLSVESNVPTPGACVSGIPATITTTMTLNPGTYCADIKTGTGADVTFNPGLYVLDKGAGIFFGGTSKVRGTGVTFFAVGNLISTWIIDNTATDVALTAPTSGTYANILFASLQTDISGASRFQSDLMALNGVIYFPHMHLEFKGNGSADYTILVVDNIKFSGNSSLKSNFAGLPGGSGPGPVSKAE